MRWVAAFAGLVLLGAPAWAGAGPDVSVRSNGPISLGDSQDTGSAVVTNNGPGDTKVQVVWDVSGLDPSVVSVSARTLACPQAQPQRYGTCWFPLPAGAGVDVSFPGFTLAPVAGKFGPAGSLVVSVRSDAGTDPVAANNSVTIPVVVPGPPPSTPPPTTPPPTTPPPTTAPASPSLSPSPSSPAVPVPTPTPPAGSGGGLPVTGSQSAVAGGIGLAVLLLGAALFLVGRRRRVVVVAPRDSVDGG